MPLKDDVAQLKAELAQLQSLHLSQQFSLSRQLAEFSTKLDTLSQQIATEDASDTTVSMAAVSMTAGAASIAAVVPATDNAPTLTYAIHTPILESAPVAPVPVEPNPWQQNAVQGDPWQRNTKKYLRRTSR